jgi:hypothetical protein
MNRLAYILASICLLGTAVTAENMNYVIKVTPTLVYIDGGQTHGIHVGDAFIILRAEKKDRFAQVAQVSVIRVFEEFSIAEISSVVGGENIEMLQRAISRMDWEQMGRMAEADMKKGRKTKAAKRFAYLIGDGEWSKETKLRWQNDRLMGVGSSNEAGIGLRIGKVFADHVRLSLTYRVSGDLLGVGDGDVTQLSIEVDGQILPRPDNKVGPYFGVGVGMHQLNWDAVGNNDDSANKAGLQFPFSDGRWRFFVEGGYQRVAKFDDLVDASHVRSHLGFGRNF